MREDLSWMGKAYSEKQVVTFVYHPAQTINPSLVSLLERYAEVEGFANTLAKCLLELKKETK